MGPYLDGGLQCSCSPGELGCRALGIQHNIVAAWSQISHHDYMTVYVQHTAQATTHATALRTTQNIKSTQIGLYGMGRNFTSSCLLQDAAIYSTVSVYRYFNELSNDDAHITAALQYTAAAAAGCTYMEHATGQAVPRPNMKYQMPPRSVCRANSTSVRTRDGGRRVIDVLCRVQVVIVDISNLEGRQKARARVGLREGCHAGE